MNILIITGSYYPQVGGVAEVVKNLCEQLVNNGHQCSVITIFPNKSRHKIIRKNINGVNIYYINPKISVRYTFGFVLGNLKTLLRDLGKKSDIINIHGYHSLLSYESITMLSHLVENVPIIFTPHYHGIGHTKLANILHKLYRVLWKDIFNKDIISKIVCVSRYEAKRLKHDFDLSDDKIEVIPNGVDVFARSIYKKKTKIGKEPIRLLYVGRLEEYKGVQYILKSMKVLEDKYGVNTILTIVGNGPYRERLINLTKKLRLEENIRLLNNVSRDELYKIYRSHDILLLLSKAEAYGMVVAEALASGTPCIVSTSMALKEFTHVKGCYGVSWPPDPEEVAKIILYVVRNDIKIGGFSKKIQPWKAITRKYEMLFYSILEEYSYGRISS